MRELFFFANSHKIGTLAVGYAYEAQEYSEKTHRLPPPGVVGTMGQMDYALIYKDILDVLNVEPKQTFNKDDPKRPCFFVSQESIGMIESVLDQLSTRQWRQTLNVFPMEVLFNRLKNKVNNTTMRITITNMMLERGDFNCAPNIACQFHIDEEIPLQCALSHPKRWFYMFCDHICTGIGIKLVAGVHLPPNAEVNAPPPSSPLRPYDSWDD